MVGRPLTLSINQTENHRSIAAAFAPNKFAFITFVALMGIGAAANTPACLALITSNFPSNALRGKAVGIMGAGQPIGFTIGLILGTGNK